MGTVEEWGRAVAKKNRTRYLILESVKIAGVLGIALVAPNVLTGLAKMGVIASPRTAETAKRSYKRLVAAGLLVFDGGHLRITRRGETEMARMLGARAIRPRRWDGKWRVLMFDVPEYRKSMRDKIRRTVRVIGFERLQDSVWIYPYDCEDLITLLKADFKIGKDVLYLVVESLEGDGWLRAKFKLPKA
ncbi:MAG: hypothetical protein KBD06_01735 [Candidatus Pacebacteria bacterium]|nr:hypothetical protein [Candidatus Paceibacterota bacterium]